MNDQNQYDPGQQPQEPMFSPPPDAPIQDASYIDVPETSWPKVIGIISIVLASLGLACYGCNSVSTVFQPMMLEAIPEDQRPPTPQGMQLYIGVANMCVSFLLSVWLLIAGIMTVKRKPSARTQNIGWSIVKIIVVLIALVVNVLLFAEDMADQMNWQFEQQAQQTGNPPVFTFDITMVYIMLGVTAAVGLVWPVILLIWFSRGKIKDEVATWSAIERDVI